MDDPIKQNHEEGNHGPETTPEGGDNAPSEAGEQTPPPPPPVEASTTSVATTAAAQSDGLPNKEERNWALLAHLSTFSSFIGIPGFIGPLVVWLVKKDEMPFAGDQSKEALNFQISLFIYFIVSAILMFVFIGFFLVAALFGIEVIFTIIAAMQASEGRRYRYPLTIRLIQ